MRLDRALTLYLQLRTANGSPRWSGGRVLKHFARVVGPSRELDSIRPGEVRAFLDGRHQISRYWHKKYSALRRFFRFARARRFTSTVPLPIRAPKVVQSFKPYIYSHDELRRLLDASQERGVLWIKMRPTTFRTLVLLLYGAGFRLGEALRLKQSDFDLHQNILTIRCTKYYKTRQLPIGAHLGRILQAHLRERLSVLDQNSSHHVLTYIDGSPVREHTARRAFLRARARADIARHDASRYQPRLHDLRATFAVHRLISWYREGADVQRMLPWLSTYLGHTSVSDHDTRAARAGLDPLSTFRSEGEASWLILLRFLHGSVASCSTIW